MDRDGPELEMPSSIEAEKVVLGAVMLEPRMLDQMGELRADQFYEPLHGRIWTAIKRLIESGKTANPVTVRPLLLDDPQLNEVGGPAYLLRLTEDSACLIAAKDCAQLVRESAALRSLLTVGFDIVDAARRPDPDMTMQDRIAAAEAALLRVEQAGDTGKRVASFAQAAMDAVATVGAAIGNDGNLAGLSTGLAELDRKLGGLANSDLLILAGRPAMGKTALATNIAFSVARRAMANAGGAGVAFFSLEMSSGQLANRILAEQSGISGESLRTGRINQLQFNEFARTAEEFMTLPFFIDETPMMTIDTLCSSARSLKRRHNIGLVVVDYLQLINAPAGTRDNRVTQISDITRGLKMLAKELDIPVIALSQLSRQVEQRDDKRPQLSDLRESGAIEQDSDIVMFVYREEYYHETKKPDAGSEKYQAWLDRAERIKGKAEVIVAKQRHGSTGSVPLNFESSLTRFSDPVPEGAWA